MPFKTLALLILALVYLYGMLLKLLKYRSAFRPVPLNVVDVYDLETYKTWQAYHAEKTRLSMLEETAGFLLDFLLLGTDAYAAFARLFSPAPFLQLFSVVLLSAAAQLLLLPFAYYNTMVIEEKYGFNRSTKKTFYIDRLKEFLIGLLLLTAVSSLLMGLHQWLRDWLILAFAAAMTLLALLISFLYPILSKVFNKFTPLEEEELKDKLSALLEKNGYQVRAIQVMDASKRSTKSNAYFTGFGKMKTIVLYDTLVRAMEADEICAVFAHEMGHGLHKDTLKNQLLSFVQMAVLGVLAYFTLRSADLFSAFGFSAVNYGFAVVLIMSVEFSLIAPLFGLLSNAVSRRAEYRADAQAAREGYASALVRALKKLAKENFADLSPHPLLVQLEYSHPTLSQRISALEKESEMPNMPQKAP